MKNHAKFAISEIPSGRNELYVKEYRRSSTAYVKGINRDTYCRIGGEADNGTNTPLKKIIGKRIEFTTIIMFRGSFMMSAIKTPIDENARLAKILATVSKNGLPTWIPRNGSVINVVIRETNKPKVKLPTTLPITISQ